MTFEYRDADGGHLSVTPLPGVPYVLVRTDPEGCAVPADLVPDAIAGIRDTARTASGQTDGVKRSPDATIDPTMCPRCKGDNQEAFELCGNCTASGQQHECAPCGDTGACNGGPCAHPDAAPAVGQPAEAQATEVCTPRIRWAVEHRFPAGTTILPGVGDRAEAQAHLEATRARWPDATHRLVRETTTWTVEDER